MNLRETATGEVGNRLAPCGEEAVRESARGGWELSGQPAANRRLR